MNRLHTLSTIHDRIHDRYNPFLSVYTGTISKASLTTFSTVATRCTASAFSVHRTRSGLPTTTFSAVRILRFHQITCPFSPSSKWTRTQSRRIGTTAAAAVLPLLLQCGDSCTRVQRTRSSLDSCIGSLPRTNSSMNISCVRRRRRWRLAMRMLSLQLAHCIHPRQPPLPSVYGSCVCSAPLCLYKHVDSVNGAASCVT